MTPTSLQQLQPVLREALGVQSIIGRMGFPAADLYLVCFGTKPPAHGT